MKGPVWYRKTIGRVPVKQPDGAWDAGIQTGGTR